MMKTGEGTLCLLLIGYYKLISMIQEAVLYPRTYEQPEKHSEANSIDCLKMLHALLRIFKINAATEVLTYRSDFCNSTCATRQKHV